MFEGLSLVFLGVTALAFVGLIAFISRLYRRSTSELGVRAHRTGLAAKS
jgi:hypothetical protein